MKTLANKETVTSRELLEQINMFREQEGKSKLENYDLKKIIRKELKKDFNAGKISCIKETDSRGREQDLYILTFSQGKRVLLRESPTVRQAVIEYIEKLENAIIKLQEQKRHEARLLGKITRKLETDSIKGLMIYGKIEPRNQWKYYKHYTNLIYSVMGYNPKNKPRREEMTQSELIILDKLESVVNMEINNNIALRIPFIMIYQNVKDKVDEVYRGMRKLFILEQKNNNNLMLQ
jgi:hypothetical protein F3_00847